MSALFPKNFKRPPIRSVNAKKKYEMYCQHVISVFINSKN